MAEYMNKYVPGVFVPQELIDEMASAPKGEAIQKGIEIAARMIKAIKEEGICGGVHIMAIGREEVVPEILTEAGL
jgi:5,10-methylenetetrahydrofolate reductase